MRKVPKLRFKEFSDEWEEKKLGDILEFKNGVNASKEQYGKGIKFINVLDILNNDFITYDNIIGKVDIDNNILEKYSVTYGDILFQRSSETREEVGMANVYLDKKNIATFGGFVIRGKKIGEYIPIFLNKLLKTNLARNEITSKSGGSTRYNVGQETLKDVRLLFPIIQKQKKIANFLNNIDKKISLTEEKLELFREYKKGVMQKIFSQELRFKDSNGNDYPEWEEKTLGNYINFLTGYPFNSKKFNEEKRGVPLIRIRNLLDSNISTYYEGEYENKYIIKREDILIGMDGDFNVVKWKNNGALLNQRIVKVFSKNNLELCNTFLYYILEKPIKNINLKTFSTTVKHLSVKDIEKIIVNLPILKEQEKIANFLSDIDNKIENIEKELEGLKEFKKGLLQQMFV